MKIGKRFLAWLGITASTVELKMAPHQQWPEILEWQVGDQFDSTWGMRHTQYDLVAIREDGYAVVEFCGEREWAPIGRLIGKNTSLRTRRVNASLRDSTEYMDLLNEFHKAYAELEARDKKLKLAS